MNRKNHNPTKVESSRLIAFHKPYQVLCQFTDQSPQQRQTLADYIPIPGIYAAGRLDYDSEGLLLLTNNGRWQQQIANPSNKLSKTYWVQVEGAITDAALHQLSRGVQLKDGLTRPAKTRRLDEPDVGPRQPPIRQRQQIPTSWLELSVTEGRNRQVRRMTAAVGFPTLRLIRVAIGPWQLAPLAAGEYQQLTEAAHFFNGSSVKAGAGPRQRQRFSGVKAKK